MKQILQTFIKHFKSRALPICLLLSVLSVQTANAQEISISGTITSQDGETLPNVNIVIQGTVSGTATNIDGNYTLNAPADAILVVSFLGFRTQLVPVDGRRTIDIVLEEDFELLDELIVIGYGTIKRSHLTGSVSKVENVGLDEIPLSRLDDALVGQIAGVSVQQTNPAAGEAPVIRVRGQGSISFDSDPLIVVDGIVTGSDADFLSSLDMNDVESIEVLKDASSAAIYGSRGANGILMVTTKQGKEGPTQFSYSGYVGFKSVAENDVLTTPSEWADFVRANNGGELTDRMKYIEQLGTYTNWEDVMMDGGSVMSHSLSMKGGTKNTRFFASINQENDEGVLLTDNYEKLNFRIRLDTKLRERVEFGLNLNPSTTEQRRFPTGVHDALRQSPWLPLYLDETTINYVNRYRENCRWEDAETGDYGMERMFDDFNLGTGMPDPGTLDCSGTSGTDISTTSNQSSLAKVLERDRRKFQTKVYANTYLKFRIADGFQFKQTFGGDYRYTRNLNWTGVLATRNGAADSESFRSTSSRWHVVTESTLNFSKDINEHEVDAVAGFAYEDWDYEVTGIDGSGFINDLIQTIPGANSIGANTQQSENRLVSYFSRINYAFADKYLVSLSGRIDGSSKFGPDKKYGFFPAASVGWVLTEEAFLENLTLVQDLKLRFSYGLSGTDNYSRDPIEQYLHTGLLSPVGTGFGSIGYNPINIANPDLGWESLIEINPGLDVAFFNRRVNVSFDYYKRTSKDLLLGLLIPSVTGFEDVVTNRGEVENEGFELEVLTRNVLTKHTSWTTSAIISHNKNTLVDFAGSNGLITFVDDKRPAEWIALEGEAIASFYGYVIDREIDLQYITDPFYPINAQSQDIYVKDLNGDGVIDTDDRTILGSPYPDLEWSLTNTIKYKNFDLSFMFQGSHGAEVRNISGQYINNEFSGRQDYTSDFPDADLVEERIFTNDDIQDASYIALRNINLGYSFSSSFLAKTGIQRAKVYAAASNLLYFMADGYIGYNPEGIDQGRDSPLTYGYQRGPAPIYRSLNFGINLDF